MMAFGDTYNDAEMLQTVRYGFLMENGSEPLRQKVPFLAPSHPGSRCHAGLTPCSGTERLCLSGGFYPGTLNPSIKNGAVTHLV